MLRALFSCLLFLACSLLLKPAYAQKDSSTHIRVSLLTVGVGDEIYAAFGHTGIRITDSTAGTDIVYNWGTFDGFQEHFELKFMRGKLLYYCSSESYQHFIQTYIQEDRAVEEQQVYLNPIQARSVQAFLQENLKDENRYYKYDFLYDNCATRPRDVFKKTFGTSFRFGRAIPEGKQLSFRDEINHYLASLPWERLGINLLLGMPVDKVMSNEDAMFLPDFLAKGMAGARVNGTLVSEPAVQVLPASAQPPASRDFISILFLGVALLIIVGTAIPGIKPIAVMAVNLLLVVTGLLGCLMVFMWLGTDHPCCRNNINLLWCLPTNMIIPFVRLEKRQRYAIVALVLLLLAGLLHLLSVQQMPMAEIWPLLLALLYSFGMIFRWSKVPLPNGTDDDYHH
ncbi:MAG: DUF4105 domain-containing protein [Bacteroidetes bacterium]|nr:DUF4105 domain-containing protein [Bacteroidota bacterium]MBS1630309.1 DUF4105 domain-containing protein [Bacteroidota bacterium]